jgi:hypothetical protein
MSIKIAFKQNKSIFDETISRNTMGKNDILDEFYSIINENATDFKSRVAKFGSFLKFIKKNKNKFNESITHDVLITLFEKDNINDINGEYKIFCDILTDKKIMEFIFEFNYIDDFKNGVMQ